MRYEVVIEFDDKTPKAPLLRIRINERLASILELGNLDGIDVTVQTSHPSTGPIQVHAHGGRVRTMPESLPPSSVG